MTIDEWQKNPWTFMLTVVVFMALVVAAILVLDNGSAGKAPADWNPNATCHIHHGVRQVSSSDGYVVAVVCADGTFISNPYD